MTVEELLSRMSSRELTEWMAYSKIQHDDRESNRKQRENMKALKGKVRAGKGLT